MGLQESSNARDVAKNKTFFPNGIHLDKDEYQQKLFKQICVECPNLQCHISHLKIAAGAVLVEYGLKAQKLKEATNFEAKKLKNGLMMIWGSNYNSSRSDNPRVPTWMGTIVGKADADVIDEDGNGKRVKENERSGAQQKRSAPASNDTHTSSKRTRNEPKVEGGQVLVQSEDFKVTQRIFVKPTTQLATIIEQVNANKNN